MSKLILIVGIVQLVAGIVIVGMVAKDFSDEVNKSSIVSSTASKVNAFGPVLIGLLIVSAGIFGILSDRCNSARMDVFYLISTTVAASAAAAMLWFYALKWHSIDEACNGTFKICPYTEETKNITITLLVFSIAACAMSVLGLVSAGLTTCRKL